MAQGITAKVQNTGRETGDIGSNPTSRLQRFA
jgi:hypothetical protein